jgi:tripartite-type tricarboxylate transporter receptor subunit TctC
VPTIFELMDQYKVTDSKRRLVNSYLGIWGFGSRPIVSTPGIPVDRFKILRDAFMKMFKDPDLLDEMKKRNWQAEPVAGEELEALAKAVVNQPPDVAAALKRILSK